MNTAVCKLATLSGLSNVNWRTVQFAIDPLNKTAASAAAIAAVSIAKAYRMSVLSPFARDYFTSQNQTSLASA